MNPDSPLVVAVMGRGIVAANTPLLSPFDQGLTRGDGCFDVCRVVCDQRGKRVDHFEAHLSRFNDSAKALGLGSLDLDAWRALVGQAVTNWPHMGEAIVKMVLTRGAEGSPQPSAFVTISPLPPETLRIRQGMKVATIQTTWLSLGYNGAPWLLGGVKTLSYAVNMAARREAQHRGADDGIFVSAEGNLLEATTAGIIFAKDEQLWTTPIADTGVLRSITVEAVLRTAEADGVGVGKGFLTKSEIPELQGLWLASATGVKPVLELDGRPVMHVPALTNKLATCGGFDPVC